MRAVLLAGHKDSGKTRLAEALCRTFHDMGVTVAVAKFSHHLLDRQGSDTRRLGRVADGVLALDPESSSLTLPGHRSLQDLLPLISAEVLLVEGGKHLGCLPRIVLPREGDDPDQLSRGLGLAQWPREPSSGLRALSDAREAAGLILDRGFLLPDLDCGGCGREDCLELAREIVTGRAEASECVALSTRDIELAVNGQTVPLNPFVRNLLRNTLRGMLSSLKGCESGQVEIRMDTPDRPSS